ncbi:hypothetical protein IDJ77_11355 [Mucilaginibacter sp. ZT4R22]|uniref:Uncharacterized protein n=1 Tax=Mucilaginibacter pankratovii TaxID=2772110 RepID=A0ABR7WQ06_9SPHI|nr:hypothetical protein [Mucilaginibacter pankratovii]MBD1364406.1 hypothetical protein [Mucilaginibacter pankratovii]
MKYGIDLSWNLSIEVEAENPKEALAEASKFFPNHIADFMVPDEGESISVDRCEGCGAYIIEGEEGSYDPEQGNAYCTGCTEAIKEDMEKYPEEYKDEQ